MILAFVKIVHVLCSVGAILVFLPGYDDIVTLRETIVDSMIMEKFR